MYQSKVHPSCAELAGGELCRVSSTFWCLSRLFSRPCWSKKVYSCSKGSLCKPGSLTYFVATFLITKIKYQQKQLEEGKTHLGSREGEVHHGGGRSLRQLLTCICSQGAEAGGCLSPCVYPRPQTQDGTTHIQSGSPQLSQMNPDSLTDKPSVLFPR